MEHLHFGHALPDVTVIQVSYNVDLRQTNANIGRIMRIMEINIWFLEPLFVLNIQIFDIITHLAGQTYVWQGCKWYFAGKIKSQDFGVSLKFLVCKLKYCI